MIINKKIYSVSKAYRSLKVCVAWGLYINHYNLSLLIEYITNKSLRNPVKTEYKHIENMILNVNKTSDTAHLVLGYSPTSLFNDKIRENLLSYEGIYFSIYNMDHYIMCPPKGYKEGIYAVVRKLEIIREDLNKRGLLRDSLV